MNLKKNNGYVGVDLSIALIILLVLIPAITGMIYNLNKENKSLERKSQALNFAINVIETAKGIEPTELEITKLEEELCTYYQDNVDVTNSNTDDGILILKKDSVTYNLKIEIVDYSQIDTNVAENKAKSVNIAVTYLLGGKEQKVELSTTV